MSAIQPGRLRRVKLLLAPLRFKTRMVHRPDANALMSHHHADVSWSGFEATLDPKRLRGDGTWEVYITARVGLLRRRRVRFHVDDVLPPRTAELPAPDGVVKRAVPTPDRRLELQVREQWAALRESALDGDELVLRGTLRAPDGAELKLELLGGDGSKTLRRPVAVEGETFSARVPLKKLRGAAGTTAVAFDEDNEEDEDADDEHDVAPSWELFVTGGGERRRVTLPEGSEEARWDVDGGELALVRTRQGEASLTLRAPHAVIDELRWTGERRARGGRRGAGRRAAGRARAGLGGARLPARLAGRDRGRALQRARDRGRGRLARRPAPAGRGPLAAVHPRRGRRPGARPSSRCRCRRSCRSRRRPAQGVRARHDRRGPRAARRPAGPRPPASAARYHQRRLRETVYLPQRTEPLRDDRRLHELPRAPVLRQPARDPRGARAPRRAARAPVDHQGRRRERAADGDASCARAAARRTRRWRGRATSSPTTTSTSGSAAARTRCACRPGTARRSSASASTSPSCAAAPASSRPTGTSSCATGSTSSPPAASPRRSCSAPTGSRARCSRRATRAPTSLAGDGLEERSRRAARAARHPGRRAHRALRADLPRPGARPPRPLPAGPPARPRAPARRARAGHRPAVPQAPLHRRRRADDRRRLRPRRLHLPRRHRAAAGRRRPASPTTRR